MNTLALIPLLAVAGCVLAVLAWKTHCQGRARQNARLGYFDECRSITDQVRIRRCPTGFPRMAAHYKGVDCDLQAVPDTLTFRKLPALWVLVTIPEPLPLRSTIDLMIRPTGIEPFSGYRNLPHQIDAPAGFPADCGIRTDDTDHLLAAEMLRPHLSLFDDVRVKELVISPKGLRLVFLAEEADRARYLLFREAEMGRVPLPADRVRHALDCLLSIRNDLTQDSGERTAA